MANKLLIVVQFCVIVCCFMNTVLQGFKSIEHNKLTYRSCVYEEVYRNISDISFQDCIQQCQLRLRCNYILYKRSVNLCGLLENLDKRILGKERPLCFYRNTISRTHLSQCSRHECIRTEKCVGKDYGYKCVKSECSSPPEINVAYPLTKVQAVGNSVAYSCHNGLQMTGSPVIKCEDNATWSKVNFTCDGSLCREPKLPDFVDVVSTAFPYRAGTIITYKCKHVDTRKVLTVTCMEDGKWSPDSIECCPEGNLKFKWLCIDYHNSSGNNTYEDIIRTCGKLFHINRDFLLHFNLSETGLFGYRVWNRKGKGQNAIYEREKQCVLNTVSTMGNITIPDIYSNTTYRELIEIMRQGKWFSNCLRVASWAEGHPDGNDCVVTGYDTSYKRKTVPCEWTATENYAFACRTRLYSFNS